MGIALILTFIVFLLLLAHLRGVKKEVKSLSNQLKEINSGEKDQKVTINSLDRQIEKLAQEINEQIDQRKGAMAEKIHTQAELKQAISHISHDIRTPMTSILGYVQLLKGEELSAEQRDEYIFIVENSAKRLKVLLEEFFELSTIERSDYPLKMEKVKLNQLILEVLLGFYEEFHQKNIEPILKLEEDVTIMTDSSAVKRVLENLLMNVVKYGDGTVVIELKEEESTVMLTVSNGAKDLSQLDAIHMFDRFYKADQARMGKGIGLGLAISKSLMVKMNGNINAELTDGKLFVRCQWK